LEHIDEDSGIKLRGALDDLFVTSDGYHVPVDFKMRGFRTKDGTDYQHQMDIYCFLLEKNGVKAGNFAYLIFYYPTKAEGNGRFKFDIEIVKLKTNMHDGEKLFKEAIKVLQGPEPEADENCPWCNWNKF
jgi:CRISPR/Cas system-associated exonuclease Cas4 (RecB family)